MFLSQRWKYHRILTINKITCIDPNKPAANKSTVYSNRNNPSLSGYIYRENWWYFYISTFTRIWNPSNNISKLPNNLKFIIPYGVRGSLEGFAVCLNHFQTDILHGRCQALSERCWDVPISKTDATRKIIDFNYRLVIFGLVAILVSLDHVRGV